ncbi:MAG TPA: thiamine pyrophosphate-binding protein, partial [Dehalococcoidia bacterium]|nr:thiamine pyrophosphate-binding protein [Dehalococcoidia bacterium]
MRDPSSEVQTAVSPVTPVSAAQYGSDVIVDILRELKIPYAALNPGASFRGLHDSLVNYGEGQPPEIVLCCHEEIAVAMAHGYARVTGRPMAAALHNVVGLQHATMAIFNAWCDQVPVLLLGGTGPMDSEKRRPWIDWVHTALVQGNQIRDYVKWDDQPASVEAIPESLLRAYRIAMMEPRGPVYVCFDSTLQEQELVSPVAIPDPERFSPPSPPAPAPD